MKYNLSCSENCKKTALVMPFNGSQTIWLEHEHKFLDGRVLKEGFTLTRAEAAQLKTILNAHSF